MTRLKLLLVLGGVLMLLGGSLLFAQAASERNEKLLVAKLAGDAGYVLSWDVTGSSGAPMVSDSYRLHSTAGQPAIGNLQSENYQMHSGYWQSFIARLVGNLIFFPLNIRG